MRTGLLTAALVAGVGLAPTKAAGQEAPPPLALRSQFYVTLGVTSVSWQNDAVAGAAGPDLVVERRAFGPLAVRFGAATVVAREGTIDARHFFLDASVLLAPTFRLGTRNVVPQVGIGIGSTISNPAPDSLATRSQNTWSWLVGVDAGTVGPISVGVQLRRMRVRLSDLTATGPAPGSVSTGATAIAGRVGMRF